MSLISALQNPALFDHPVSAFQVVETHISWVLLTGQYAYKIKKPVNFGFLDFSTLEKRQYYCQEELRLNRRLAPQLYLDVISIHGTEAQPRFNGDGPIIEYAVRMHQFPQGEQLDRKLATVGLTSTHIDMIARTIAGFHLSVQTVSEDQQFGDPEHIAQPVTENFSQIHQHNQQANVLAKLDEIAEWSKQQLDQLRPVFIQRKKAGFVRECHGDMHLRNMALMNGDIVIFDCIEFNKNFYLIDVMSDIAFVVMDLEDRDQSPLARRFLNKYLEVTGDYAGLQVLSFYKVYRAIVRAKVDALRSSQETAGTSDYQATLDDFMQYLNLARRYTAPKCPCLLVNHGLSGSGKTQAAYRLLSAFPMVILRSDIERKRLFATRDAGYGIGEGIYSSHASEQTYAHLRSLARTLLIAGYAVVIDAANLKQAQRHSFLQLAGSLSCPCLILSYQAETAVLRQRIQQRMQEKNDASDATLEVLEHQLLHQEPLTVSEQDHTIVIDTEQEWDTANIARQVIDKIPSLEKPDTL